MLWSNQCSKCLTVKCGEDFRWAERYSIRKIMAICRQCENCAATEKKRTSEGIAKNAAYHQSRLTNPLFRLRIKAAQQSERGKELSRLAYARSKATGKRQAQILVKKAIKAGQLIRDKCEKCGSEKTHGHHDDYSKPLDVRWLCPTHHGEAHRGQRRS